MKMMISSIVAKSGARRVRPLALEQQREASASRKKAELHCSPSRRLLALLILVASMPADAATFVVDLTSDAPDANPGDGICSYDSFLDPEDFAVCTLRAAVMEANATPENQPAVVELTSGTTYKLTIAEPVQAGAKAGDLNITRSMTIGSDGQNKKKAVVDAQFKSRAFLIESGAANTHLHDLEIINGYVVNTSGSALLVRVPDVTLERLDVHDNFAGDGNALRCAITGDVLLLDSRVHNNGNNTRRVSGICDYNSSQPMLTIVRSTLDNNTAHGIDSQNSNLILHSSTISDNLIGGLYVRNSNAKVLNSTISGNGLTQQQTSKQIYFSAVDAIYKLEIYSTIIDSQLHGTGCRIEGSGQGIPVVVTKWNAANDSSCKSTTPDEGSIFDAQLNLSPLSDWGGHTPTRIPLYGSQAIDSAPVEACTELGSDQRGVFRPISVDASSQKPCDIGAVEVEQLPPPPPTSHVFSDDFEIN